MSDFNRNFIQLFCIFVSVNDAVVYEFAALAISYMATEYSSKMVIFENGGIEPLVRLLNAPDPDVKKNSIESLAQLALVNNLSK